MGDISFAGICYLVGSDRKPLVKLQRICIDNFTIVPLGKSNSELFTYISKDRVDDVCLRGKPQIFRSQ